MRAKTMVSLAQMLAISAASFNGDIQYFIADLGPTSPCHPLYEQSYTWVETEDADSLDRVLNGLADAGFNGVRLPMWPDDSRVSGPDPTNPSVDIGRDFCESLNKNWITRIKTALKDSKYYQFYIYLSPGLDNRTFQETLSEDDYAAWVLSYTESDLLPNYISPFSGNDSTLRLQAIPDSSVLSDAQTMWEMETLKKIK